MRGIHAVKLSVASTLYAHAVYATGPCVVQTPVISCTFRAPEIAGDNGVCFREEN